MSACNHKFTSTQLQFLAKYIYNVLVLMRDEKEGKKEASKVTTNKGREGGAGVLVCRDKAISLYLKSQGGGEKSARGGGDNGHTP